MNSNQETFKMIFIRVPMKFEFIKFSNMSITLWFKFSIRWLNSNMPGKQAKDLSS